MKKNWVIKTIDSKLKMIQFVVDMIPDPLHDKVVTFQLDTLQTIGDLAKKIAEGNPQPKVKKKLHSIQID